jgi:hypothetical protein
MAESTEPQTPEEVAALCALAVKHRRGHRWVALVLSMSVSVHTTVILHTLWHGWPLHECDLRRLVYFVVNALVSLGVLGWGLRELREDEALDRQETLQNVRRRAQDRAWRERWAERRWPLGEG